MAFTDLATVFDTISPQMRFGLIITIIVCTIITARLLKHFLSKWNERSTKYLNVNPTQFTFTKHFISGAIYILGFGLAIYMVPQLRTLSVSIFAGAGILAVVIGFASQAAFANIISGIFIAIFQPFRVGDRIKLSEAISGVVEDIDLRQTTIRNFENKRIIVPNSLINSSTIENSSIVDEKTIRFVDFGISYDSDIDKAMAIMAEESEQHPLCIDNRSAEDKKDDKPIVATRLVGFGDSSVNLRAWVWTRTPLDAWIAGTDLNKSIKQRFDREGIEIPFPYRTIVFKDKDKPTARRKKR